MYYQGKEYEIGDQYLDQSLKLYRRLETPIHLWSVLATLASGKLEQEQAAAALVYGEEAIVLAREIKYAYGEAFSTGTLGLILTEQGKWEAARKQLDTALLLFSAIGVQAEVAEFSYAIAELASKQGNHAEAVEVLEPVLETALKLPLPRLAKQTYLALADAYEALGQPHAALSALKSHQLLQDSLGREKESRQFSEAESSYNIQQRQEKEFAALSAKQEMEHRIYLFGFISALTLCLIFSIWLGNRLQKERKKRLRLNRQFHTIWQEKNLLSSQYSRLSQLASLASASLHTPLQRVQKALASSAGSPSDASPALAFNRIENWVSDIALYASVGQVEGDKRPIDLADTVREAIGELPEPLSKQMPRIIMKDLPTILGYPQQMTLLFRQLLANAIEYRGEEAPFIEISAQDQGGKYEISLRDNGQGMPAHLAETLFDVGYRVEATFPTTSAGIGLAICKAIVELHEGQIWAESSPNGGTTILFSLPSSLHN